MTPPRLLALSSLLATFATACGGQSIAQDENAGGTGGGVAGQAGTGGTGGAGGAGGTGGGSGGLGGTGGAVGPTFAVDSVNLQLQGAFDPFHEERLAKTPALLASLPSDVVCVQEAWGPRTRSAILDGTSGAFPHRAAFDFDLDTVPDDPTNQQGVVPPLPSSPPCSASEDRFADLVDCIQNECVVPAQDPSGKPVDNLSDCLTNRCLPSLFPLPGGTEEDRTCWSCTFTQLTSWASPDELRARCGQDPRARFAWNGDAGTFLLSRHPIQNSEAWVLPSTDFRVIVARAEVTPPDGEPVDVYCTSLTQPGVGIVRPYTGQYGNGAAADDAWREELYLQADRLVKTVQQSMAARGKSGMLVGTLYAGPQGSGDLQPVNDKAFDIVSTAFPLAVPPGFTPSCTYCSDNPYFSPPGQPEPGDSSWQSFVFQVGSPAWTPLESTVFLKDAVVRVTTHEGKELMAPLSTHYGFRTTFAGMK